MAFLLPINFFFNTSLYAQENADNTEIKQAEVIENDTEQSHTIYFSLADQYNAPQEQAQSIFDCSDKIYTVVELTNFPEGKHQISVLWSDPFQTVREHTKYDFRVRKQDTRLWAWLSLSRGAGAGMLQWINPAAGMEDFIGIWEIEVQIDGKTLEKGNFEVSC